MSSSSLAAKPERGPPRRSPRIELPKKNTFEKIASLPVKPKKNYFKVCFERFDQ